MSEEFEVVTIDVVYSADGSAEYWQREYEEAAERGDWAAAENANAQCYAAGQRERQRNLGGFYQEPAYEDSGNGWIGLLLIVAIAVAFMAAAAAVTLH